MTDIIAADPAGSEVNLDEFEVKLEEMFDKADQLMITHKNYKDAVSFTFQPRLTLYHRLTSTSKYCS